MFHISTRLDPQACHYLNLASSREICGKIGIHKLLCLIHSWDIAVKASIYLSFLIVFEKVSLNCFAFFQSQFAVYKLLALTNPNYALDYRIVIFGWI